MNNEFEVFDTTLALYHWLQDNCEGPTDALYESFRQLTAPGMYYCGNYSREFSNMDEFAREVYDVLTRDNYMVHLYQVLNYKSSETE